VGGFFDGAVILAGFSGICLKKDTTQYVNKQQRAGTSVREATDSTADAEFTRKGLLSSEGLYIRVVFLRTEVGPDTYPQIVLSRKRTRQEFRVDGFYYVRDLTIYVLRSSLYGSCLCVRSKLLYTKTLNGNQLYTTYVRAYSGWSEVD
jgi:hypothetical protein